MMFREPLYQRRSIGEKMDVTFSFVRENIGPILKSVTLFSLPFCLIITIVSSLTVVHDDLTMSGVEWNFADAIILDQESKIFCLALALCLLFVVPLSFTLVRLNYSRDGGLKDIKVREIIRSFRQDFVKSLTMPFLQISLYVLLYLIVKYMTAIYIEGAAWMFYIILAIISFVMFSMSLPLYCVEGRSYGHSFGNSLAYGITHFWNTLLFAVVTFFICMLTFLWAVMLMELLNEVRPEIIGSSFSQHPVAYIISWIVLTALWAVISLGVSIALSVVCVGISFQMGYLEERNNMYSLIDKINNFENLKDP